MNKYSMIPYNSQEIDESDIKKLTKVIKSKYLTQGPECDLFEDMLSTYLGCKYSIGVNSCTSALHLACIGLGICRDDIVWTTPNSFVSTSNAALMCGANVDFVDIELTTYNLCLNKLEKKLKRALEKQKLPKLVIVVHLAGVPINMERLRELSIQYRFKVIEDCAHALGSTYLDSKIGSCKYSDISVTSFHPIKSITTCEGGAVFTNSLDVANYIKCLRSNGVERTTSEIPSVGKLNYQAKHLGYNYRLNEIQSSLGQTQLKKLDKFVAKRARIAEYYYDNLRSELIQLPFVPNESKSSWHLFILRILDDNNLNLRDKLASHLLENNIQTNIHYIPIYLHPLYKQMGFKTGYCKLAEKYYKTAISIPIYSSLSEQNLKHVTQSINNFFNEY